MYFLLDATYNMGPFFTYNNTLVNYSIPLYPAGEYAAGITSENNLFSEGTVSTNYFYDKDSGSNSLTTVITVSDYNSFFGGRGYSFNSLATNGYWCWPQSGGPVSGCGALGSGPWTNSGFDTHSISANPLLDANYHLQAGSPDIQAGANLTSLCSTIAPLCYDAAGVARPPTGAWDIGAYQYVPSVYRVLGSHMLGGGRTVQ